MVGRGMAGALAACGLWGAALPAHPPPAPGVVLMVRPDASYWGVYPPWDPYWPSYPSYWYPVPPPLFLPAETLYGPQAVKRFMGVDDSAALRAPLTTTAPAAGVTPAGRATNAATRALAWRFIGFGDLHFKNEKYADAYQRYRTAAEVMPDLADAHFRQAFALIATARWELAAKALRRGLSLDGNWPRSGFRLSDLYQGHPETRAAHIEALAAAAEAAPDNGDLFFLLGVALFFDGSAERGGPFLERAAELAGEGDDLKAFLEVLRGAK